MFRQEVQKTVFLEKKFGAKKTFYHSTQDHRLFYPEVQAMSYINVIFSFIVYFAKYLLMDIFYYEVT